MLYKANLFFENFSDAALAFARAADNGPGNFPNRLVIRLKKHSVDNPNELENIINQIHTVDLGVGDNKKKWPKHKPHKFGVDTLNDGQKVFRWNCEPRPVGEGENPGETTKIVLEGLCLVISSSKRASVLNRKDAALGLMAPYAWRRATGNTLHPSA